MSLSGHVRFELCSGNPISGEPILFVVALFRFRKGNIFFYRCPFLLHFCIPQPCASLSLNSLIFASFFTNYIYSQVYVTYAQAGYVSHDLEAEGLPCSVRFANFANTLSVGTSTGVVQLWDLKTRKVKKTFQVRWKIAGRQRIGRGKKLVSCQIVLKAITVTRHWRTRNEKSSLHGSKLIGVNVREIDVCLMSLY